LHFFRIFTPFAQNCASFPKQLWSEVLLMYEGSFWVSCGYLM